MDVGILAQGRIGPNAIIRAAEALEETLGAAEAARLMRRAGLGHHLEEAPSRMVPEGEVTALHRVVRGELGEVAADFVSREAGRRTALYLLAHRIPRPMQWLLRHLPPWPSARILLRAIGGHAWTFAGSGRFRVLPGRPLRLEIAGGPIARAGAARVPVCGFYTATFETLFRALVAPGATVTEIACEACGAPACVFEIRW